jgi:hypothetical protein
MNELNDIVFLNRHTWVVNVPITRPVYADGLLDINTGLPRVTSLNTEPINQKPDIHKN